MGQIELFGEFDGIQAGVLLDGTPFLTGKGLAHLCGVTRQTINDWGQDTPSPDDKFRSGKLALLLQESGFTEDRLYTKYEDSSQPEPINAYSDSVCMAFLEYYAFEAGERSTEKAKTVFRQLAKKTFRDFVYSLVGYKKQRISFSDYVLSRITNHHDVSINPLPDGYFCLFDKMIEILQKFDIRIKYQLGEQWYDYEKGDKRFLEPDISLGRHFSSLFQDNYIEIESRYYQEFDIRKNNPSIKPEKFWTKKLVELRWTLDKASAEKALREKYNIDTSHNIDRQSYTFRPSPDSNRPETLLAYCYSNDYTSLFYDWLKDVFFKFVWRDYILKRDEQGWLSRYDSFKLLPDAQQQAILSTTEGKLIEGFEYRDRWERLLEQGS